MRPGVKQSGQHPSPLPVVHQCNRPYDATDADALSDDPDILEYKQSELQVAFVYSLEYRNSLLKHTMESLRGRRPAGLIQVRGGRAECRVPRAAATGAAAAILPAGAVWRLLRRTTPRRKLVGVPGVTPPSVVLRSNTNSQHVSPRRLAMDALRRRRPAGLVQVRGGRTKRHVPRAAAAGAGATILPAVWRLLRRTTSCARRKLVGVPGVTPLRSTTLGAVGPAYLSPPGPPNNRPYDAMDAGALSDDPDFQESERKGLELLVAKNGGALVGDNPRMRRSVRASSAAAADAAYRSQRERNNRAAKQSRDRRKLHLSLKAAYLQRQVVAL